MTEKTEQERTGDRIMSEAYERAKTMYLPQHTGRDTRFLVVLESFFSLFSSNRSPLSYLPDGDERKEKLKASKTLTFDGFFTCTTDREGKCDVIGVEGIDRQQCEIMKHWAKVSPTAMVNGFSDPHFTDAEAVKKPAHLQLPASGGCILFSQRKKVQLGARKD